MIGAHTDEVRSIPQYLLDVTAEALLSGDFSKFAPHFRLPQSAATIDGCVLMRSPDDLRQVFDRMSSYFRGLGVTRLQRDVTDAHFDGPDIIRYAHASRLLSENTLLSEPYHSASVAERGPDGWQVTSSRYSFADRPEHSAALLAPELARPAPEDLDAAQGIFQNFLNRMTTAYLTGDIETACDSVKFPYFSQKSAETEVFTDRETFAKSFRRYQTDSKVHRITDLVRQVKSAEFVGNGRLHGTFRTHVLRGTELLLPAYVSAMTLEQGPDKIWRVTMLMHPMGRLTLERIVSGRAGAT